MRPSRLSLFITMYVPWFALSLFGSHTVSALQKKAPYAHVLQHRKILPHGPKRTFSWLNLSGISMLGLMECSSGKNQ